MPAADATATRPYDPADRVRPLPLWPMWLTFAWFPLCWVLGLGGFITQLAAVPMAGYLLTSGRWRVPRGFGLWLLFLMWTCFSVVEIRGSDHLAGFLYRATLYLAATIYFLYVYNCSPTRLPLRKLALMATCFMAFVVVGGLLGMVAPHHVLTTPVAKLIPQRFADNDLINKLVRPPFAQTSASNYIHVKPRPAAPFPYTNDWGVNFALLVPFVIALITLTKNVRHRAVLVGLLVVGALPAVDSLNRGMVLGLGVGLIYAAIRFAMRGNAKALVGVLVVIGIAFGLASALHFTSKLEERTSASHSAQGRTTEYAETWDATKASPILGHGAPSASTGVSSNGTNLGTQGQIWTVMYSAGFPGLALFVLALIVFAWTTRKPATSDMMWMHVVPVVALAVITVYRMQDTELVLLMVAVAICLRDRPRVVRRVASYRPVGRELAATSG